MLCLYQMGSDFLDSRTKRLWAYVNAPIEKLLYIVEVVERTNKMPENSNCVDEDCFKDAKEFNERKSRTYKSEKISKCAHKLKLLYKFDNPLTLQQFKSYKNQETESPWKPSQSGIKALPRVSVFSKLVEVLLLLKLGKPDILIIKIDCLFSKQKIKPCFSEKVKEKFFCC